MFPIASPQRDSRQIGIRWQVLPTYVYQSHRHRHEIKMKSSHMYQSHRHRHELKMKLTAHRGGFHKHNCFLARLHHRPRFIECLHDDIPKKLRKSTLESCGLGGQPEQSSGVRHTPIPVVPVNVLGKGGNRARRVISQLTHILLLRLCELISVDIHALNSKSIKVNTYTLCLER